MTDCQNDFTYPSHPRQNRSSGDEAEPNPAAAAAPPRRRGRPPSSGHRGRGRGRGRGSSSSSSGSGFVNTYKLPEEVAKRANLPPPPNSDVVQANAALKVPRGERKRVDSREWWWWCVCVCVCVGGGDGGDCLEVWGWGDEAF